MGSKKIKAAVIGVGYLGQFHAEKLSRMEGVELVGVVDADLNRAREIAGNLKVEAFGDHTQLLDKIDAATVVTPTVYHHRVAADLLRAGVDVLCEKPITVNLEEADQLIELAAAGERILQVGHLERFNPAVEGMVERVKNPLFIECNRIAPFKARATDVDVGLDLMIHDLDIILALVGEAPCEVRAVGVPVLGPEHADIVNARLEFSSGCVANVTASRLALKDERKMRVFQPDSYVHLDFKKRKLLVVSGVEYVAGKKPKVRLERPRFGKSDPLERELSSFMECVRTRQEPRVSGGDGRRALACALSVTEKVKKSLSSSVAQMAAECNWVGFTPPEED